MFLACSPACRRAACGWLRGHVRSWLSRSRHRLAASCDLTGRGPWSSVAQVQGADTGVRPADHGLTPIQRDEHEARWSFPASVRCFPLLWSLPLPIQRSFDQGVTSGPGLGSCQNSTRAAARTGSAVSANKGDRYLRDLFVAGALAVIRYAKIHGTKHRPWLTALLARRRLLLSRS